MVDNVSIIGVFNLTDFITWVDTSYAVHPNLCIHKGGVMSMNYGILHCQFSKKNVNVKSLTEAELIVTTEYDPFNV